MKLYVKNMVCGRCKMVVESQFTKLGLHPVHIELGEVEIREKEITSSDRKIIHDNLMKFGFELIDDKKSRIIEKIKNIIVERVHYTDDQVKTKLSNHLSKELHHDYTYLSNLFSETEGVTIEKYFINQKVEKVKELLMYDELSLSQIADKLNYSHVAHLSNQFKKVTGLTPSFFKTMKARKRRGIEEV
jgi:AraC-like DNA-binding protein